MAGCQQSRNQQRDRAKHEAEHKRPPSAPPPPAQRARGFRPGDARDEFGVFVERALTLASFYVGGICLMYTSLGIVAGLLGLNS